MSSVSRSEIECFFRRHADGEFCNSAPELPYTFCGGGSESHLVVYAPKMPLAQRILDEVFTPAVRPALAGNMGLPGNEDLAALREFAAGRHVCFLGDCDPPDLLVFAWLRSQLGMIYVGLCDRMLADSGVVLDETCVIALSAAERQARHLMHRAVPDLRELVGDKCAALLDGGAKVELEAMNRSGAASLSKLARLFG